MTDRPIIFSGPMVRALLAGTKTQTRRVLTSARVFATPERPAWTLRGDDLTRALQNADRFRRMDGDGWFWEADAFEWQAPNTRTGWLAHIGYAPGDRLYVRENFAYVGSSDPGYLTYQATYPGDLAEHGMENIPATLKEAGYKWTPCIHMPRKLSRLTLLVTDVKIERLQAISDDNARAEGIVQLPGGMWHWIPRDALDPDHRGFHSPVGAFDTLWGSINGPTAWTDNPFVVAVSFDVVKANIDALPAEPATPMGGH